MPWDRNNTVAFNHIHHIDGVMGDGGAVLAAVTATATAASQRTSVRALSNASRLAAQ
jgi:hypothetical protein